MHFHSCRDCSIPAESKRSAGLWPQCGPRRTDPHGAENDAGQPVQASPFPLPGSLFGFCQKFRYLVSLRRLDHLLRPPDLRLSEPRGATISIPGHPTPMSGVFVQWCRRTGQSRFILGCTCSLKTRPRHIPKPLIEHGLLETILVPKFRTGHFALLGESVKLCLSYPQVPRCFSDLHYVGCVGNRANRVLTHHPYPPFTTSIALWLYNVKSFFVFIISIAIRAVCCQAFPQQGGVP